MDTSRLGRLPRVTLPTERRLIGLAVTLGIVMQIVGLGLIVAAVPAFQADRFWQLVRTLQVFPLVSTPTLFNGVMLLVLGQGIRERRRAAYWLVLALQLPTFGYAAAGALQLFGRPPLLVHAPGASVWNHSGLLIEVFTSFTLIVLLVLCRQVFTSRMPRRALLDGLLVWALGLILSFLIGFGLISMSPNRTQSVPDQLLWTLFSVFGATPTRAMLDAPGGTPHVWVLHLISAMTTTALLAAVIVFVGASIREAVMTPAQELAIRRLLLETDTEQSDSLGYYSTRREKSVVFSADRRAAITFSVYAGVAIAGGDPIGHADAWSGAIEKWMRLCQRNSWSAGVLAAGETAATAYRQAGFRIRRLGDEAILRTSEFSLRSPALHELSRTVHHFQRAGYRFEFHRQSELTQLRVNALRACASAWRHGRTERGFSMALSRLGDRSDPDLLIATCDDPEGNTIVLLTFAPWGRRGVSLDLMRRSPDADNGAVDATIASLASFGSENGIELISLNFAMFRENLQRGTHIAASAWERLNRRVLLGLSRWWQIASLMRANEKYAPEWLPRYAATQQGLSVLRFAAAAGTAEGFLPSLFRGTRRRAPRRKAAFAGQVVRQRRTVDRALRNRYASAVDTALADRVRHRHRLESAGRTGRPGSMRTVAAPDMVSLSEAILRVTGGDSEPVNTWGRVVRIRSHGGVRFLDLVSEGAELQLLLERANCAAFEELREVDPGDLFWCLGTAGTSRRGTAVLRVTDWSVLTKSLAPFPQGGHLTGTSPRWMQLSLDPAARRPLKVRSSVLRSLRQTLDTTGFQEVETPILLRSQGGANARPFTTELNATHDRLSLRIAPELALKRLVAGGFPRVYELAKDFRNEGLDRTHSPEFTVLEAYAAFGDVNSMHVLAEQLLRDAAIAVTGAPTLLLADGTNVDLSIPWPVRDQFDALSEALGTTVTSTTPRARWVQLCGQQDVPAPADDDIDRLIDRLYGKLVESRTQRPTFYTGFSSASTPLAAPLPGAPDRASRWDLVAGGMEIGTGYTELTDAVEQRKRLLEQSWYAEHGDPEAMHYDQAFIQALEYGVPPLGGLGLGVDRIIMLLTGVDIHATLAESLWERSPQ